MSTNKIDEQATTGTPVTKVKRKQSAKKAKPAGRTQRKEPADEPKADRADKKAEVVALMKRGCLVSLVHVSLLNALATRDGLKLKTWDSMTNPLNHTSIVLMIRGEILAVYSRHRLGVLRGTRDL
jgi:hypothetical protein